MLPTSMEKLIAFAILMLAFYGLYRLVVDILAAAGGVRWR